MDNSTHDMSEQLLRYLDGELSGPDKAEMEQRLSVDQGLREELENLKLTKQAVQSYGLQQHVARVRKEMKDTKLVSLTPVRRIIRYSLAAAASVLVVFLAVSVFRSASPSADKLFADNYQPYTIVTTRGNDSRSMIEEAYKNKEYSRVARLTDTSTTIKNIFLSGVSHLELKHTAYAITRFEKVLALNKEKGTKTLADESEYYLALAYLRNRQYTDADKLLTRIHNDPSHLYHEKATADLIDRIKKLE